eukprot:221591_1
MSRMFPLMSYPDIISASKNGDIYDVRIFLTTPNIDVNAISDHGMTALHWAAQKGYIEIIRALLQNPRVYVNKMDEICFTPLDLAALHGQTTAVRVMLATSKIEDTHMAKMLAGNNEIIALIGKGIENRQKDAALILNDMWKCRLYPDLVNKISKYV